MGAEFLVSVVAWPIGAGLTASFIVEALLTPRLKPLWKRPVAGMFIHIGLWLLAFTVLLAILARPWFAAAVVSAFLLLLLLVNQAKFHSLREPFVFQDFDYFTDALRHPRLYLPFLGWGKATLASLAFVLAIYGGFRLESSLHDSLSWEAFTSCMAVMTMLSAGLLWIGGRRDLLPVFEPATDLPRLGLLGSLWSYGHAERVSPELTSPYDRPTPSQPAGPLPHLVVVQSESYFDARQVFPGIRKEILEELDALRSEAVMYGQLAVPAWGANTVRTEFAFLAGLEEKLLGVHRFNPYRKLAQRDLPTVASFLRRLGYRTICIHPYPAGFYLRDRVYPRLGFDEFIDIRHFADAPRFGPYVSDLAVAEKVDAVLKASAQPAFVFVITMENHGPLHLESVFPGDATRFHTSPPPDGCDDLTVYLRHLSNASKMAGSLRNTLNALPGDAWLGWFGDHVPIMPKVYARLGVPDGKTEYFLWHKYSTCGQPLHHPLRAEELGVVLLRETGLGG